MTRPAGNPKIIASDTTYATGAKAGENTKLDPGAAITARGWYPGKRRPAKWDNFIGNDVARRLDNLDMAEALNWPPVVDEVSGSSLGGGFAAAPQIFAPAIYHVSGDTKIRQSLDGGYSWSDALTDAGAVIRDIAANDLCLMAVKTEGGAASVIGINTAATDTSALTSVTDAQIIRPDPFRSGWFWVGGLDTATPRVVRVDASAGLPGAQTLCSGGGGSTRIDFIAVGRSYILAASQTAASSNVLRRFAYADNAMNAQTQPTSSAIKELLWDDEDGYFFLFTAKEVWRSPTGASGTWTNMSAGLPGNVNDVTFILRGGCVRGSLIVIACTSSFIAANTPGLLVSGDAGVTWRLLPDPSARNAGSVGAQHVVVLDNRFGVCSYNATHSVLAQSFRAGRPT